MASWRILPTAGTYPHSGNQIPDRIAPKAFPIFIATYENLRLHCLGTKLHQREKAMGRCARDDLDETIFLKLGKRPDNIPSNLH